MSHRWRRNRSRSRSPNQSRLPIEREHSHGSRSRTAYSDRYQREETNRYRRSRSPAERRTRCDGEKPKHCGSRGFQVQTGARSSQRESVDANKDWRRLGVDSSGLFHRRGSDYSRKHYDDCHLPTTSTSSSHSEPEIHRRHFSHNKNYHRNERLQTSREEKRPPKRKHRRRGIRYITPRVEDGEKRSDDGTGRKLNESASTVEDEEKTEEIGGPTSVHMGGVIPVAGVPVRPFSFGCVVPMMAPYPVLLRPPPLFRPRVFRPFVPPPCGRFRRPRPYGYPGNGFYRPPY